MTWTGEIEPATLEQVRAGRGGKMFTIDDDVSGVAAGLRRIDPRLRLRFSEVGNYFVVYCREDHEPEGSGHLVGTFQEIDQRIVKSIEETYWKFRKPGYSFADELEAKENEAEAQRNHEMSQVIGETAERLAHALRKDLGYTDHRAFIGKGISE